MSHGQSPLDGVRYDEWEGEHDLLRFVDSEVDGIVGSVVAAFREDDGPGRAAIRASLTMDDLYTLLAYGRRSAVRALRENDAATAEAALTAIAMIDPERVDSRDVLVALALVTNALRRLTPDPDALVADAIWLAGASVAELMTRFFNPSPADRRLETWGYVEVETPEGIGLVQTGISPYAPHRGLLKIALRLAEVIEGDDYRVNQISLGEELREVWLPTSPRRKSVRVLDRSRGCVTLGAAPHPDVHPHSDAQQLTGFLVEARDDADARRISRWARPSNTSTHAALCVQDGPLVCLVIARSFVAGVEAHETTESLARFGDPLAQLLASTRHDI